MLCAGDSVCAVRALRVTDKMRSCCQISLPALFELRNDISLQRDLNNLRLTCDDQLDKLILALLWGEQKYASWCQTKQINGTV